MKESTATFDILPNELRAHIASFLDTKNLCFFATTNKQNLTSALDNLKKFQKLSLNRLHIQANMNHTVFYTPQTIYVCGRNVEGQLGLGHNNNQYRLTKLKNVPGAVRQVAAGMRHTLVLTDKGLYACGDNKYGQLGLGHDQSCNQLTKVKNIPGTIQQVAAGNAHNVVLTDQGLYTCGVNNCGQLGLGLDRTYNYSKFNKVENVPGIIRQVVAGGTHTLVLTDQGLYACGDNEYGQLGLGHTDHCDKFTKVENVPGIIQQVVAGGQHTLVLTDQGLHVCGQNEYGELGLGHTSNCNKLTKVEDVPGTVLQIAAGTANTLVVTDQGLYVCGNNIFGQLGMGHITSADTKFDVEMQKRHPSLFPKSSHKYNKHNDRLIKIENIEGSVLQVATGIGHTLLLTDQGLYSCGTSGDGQLGLGHKLDKCSPERINTAGYKISPITFKPTELIEYPECYLFTEINDLPSEVKRLFSFSKHISNLRNIVEPAPEPSIPLTPDEQSYYCSII